MKKPHLILSILAIIIINACNPNSENQTATDQPQIIGSWKLLTGTTIQGKDTTVSNYTENQELIKIISPTHFAFLRHDLGKDSIAIFVSGGGKCELNDSIYTEHLDFCNYREWENNTFEFEYKIINDTLTTIGTEHVEKLNINRLNIERYVRLKS